MGAIAGFLRNSILGISTEETSFARRRFPAQPSAARDRLECIGRTFVEGYNTSLRCNSPKELQQALDRIDLETRGFAYEGAAMGLALLDRMTPWRRNRWASFLSGPGDPHAYMVYVGAGFALAKLRNRVEPALSRLDPLLGWLVLDGYGFHEGFFHWQRSFEAREVPRKITGYARRVFDQGLGRSLWFVEGAHPGSVATRIGRFEGERRRDLWSGVGLACAYAGGIELSDIESLRDLAGGHIQCLAQGAAFAAKARERAGNPTPHTRMACEILCGMSAESASALTDETLEGLPGNGDKPAYEVWRERIQQRCQQATVGV